MQVILYLFMVGVKCVKVIFFNIGISDVFV